MRHHAQSGSAKQIPLAFSLMGSPAPKSVLHAAYERLELSRRLSFEQVMANRVYAIGVRNLADAIARRGKPSALTPLVASNARMIHEPHRENA